MTDAEKLKRCRGCRNDFYNDKNPLNVKRCWSFADAKPVIRWRTGTWMMPATPGAFVEVETLSCHHGNGNHYCDRLPAIAVDPVRLRVLYKDAEKKADAAKKVTPKKASAK